MLLLVNPQFVALGGLVWNFPTSCAWAARVYVSHRSAPGAPTTLTYVVARKLRVIMALQRRVLVVDRGARDHGLKVVGLPSRFATFQTDLGSSDCTADPLSPTASLSVCDWWDAGVLLLSQHALLGRQMQSRAASMSAS